MQTRGRGAGFDVTGDDPAGYVLSVNINRRHHTKGQQEMIAAKAR